jgi:arylformamidase
MAFIVDDFREFFDITHRLDERTPVFAGDAPFKRELVMRIADGDPANLAAVTFSLHTGTHMDAPYHVLSGARRLHEIDPRRFISKALVVACENDSVEITDFERENISEGMSVLCKTKHRDGTIAFFSPSAAEYLASLRINCIGVDALSPDPYEDMTLPVHRILFSQDIFIVENLKLDGIEPGCYTLIVTPLFITDGDGSPVRALLLR